MFVRAEEYFWMACRHSKAMMALSVIILPGTKVFWLGEIISYSRGRRRFALGEKKKLKVAKYAMRCFIASVHL